LLSFGVRFSARSAEIPNINKHQGARFAALTQTLTSISHPPNHDLRISSTCPIIPASKI
jgi:hypothetical protein